MKICSKAMLIGSMCAMAILNCTAHAASKETAQPKIDRVEIPGYAGNDFYRSIGKVRGALSCTGSFIATSSSLDAPAYVLTNGHCATDAFSSGSSNSITVDSPADYIVEFNYFHDSKAEKIPVNVKSVAYATMKGVDIAILKTDQTIGQLKQKGLEPFGLNASAGMPGENIVISGIPDIADALQNSQCTNGTQTDVVENYWHWYSMTSNACEGISPGSSGSPVFNAMRNIIGIINTTSAGAVGETCYNGNPCEVSAGGPKIQVNRNYVVSTFGLLSCFEKSGSFNISNSGCGLPKPSGIEIVAYPYIFSGEHFDRSKLWNFEIYGSIDTVRVKKIKLDQPSDSCQNMAGYGTPISVSNFRPGSEMLPVSQEGVHQYCIIPGTSQDANAPEVVQVLIDNTPPTLRPTVNIRKLGEQISIEPLFMTPEYADYYVAFGPLNSTDCANASYKHYLRIPFTTDNIPTKICVFGSDLAENKSATFEYAYPNL